MHDRDEQYEDVSALEEREPSLGEQLKAARAGKSVSIDDVASELRIERRVLEALEADELGELGAPVFVKGYIKQYGRRLGLEYDDLLAAYYRQTDAVDVPIQPNRAIQMRDERQIMIWIVTGLALLLLAVALFVWWIGNNEAPIAGTMPPETESPSPAASLAGGSGAEAAAPLPSVEESAQIEGVPTAESESGLQAEQAPPAREIPPSARPAVNVENAESPDAALPDSRSAEAAVTTMEAGAGANADLIPIEMTFVAESWAELSDARGVRLYYALGAAGTRTTVYGELPVNFFFGNADGVVLAVDGTPFEIPPQSRRGNLANFVVYPSAD